MDATLQGRTVRPIAVDVDVDRHIASCTDCRAYRDDVRRIWADLERLPVPTPAPGARLSFVPAIWVKRDESRRRAAAPDEISSNADIYVLRGTEFVKARAGSNGCACMVGRDLHEGSRYPICFDQEDARTMLKREIMEASLRARGRSEDEVEKGWRLRTRRASSRYRPNRPSHT